MRLKRENAYILGILKYNDTNTNEPDCVYAPGSVTSYRSKYRRRGGRSAGRRRRMEGRRSTAAATARQQQPGWRSSGRTAQRHIIHAASVACGQGEIRTAQGAGHIRIGRSGQREGDALRHIDAGAQGHCAHQHDGSAAAVRHRQW